MEVLIQIWWESACQAPQRRMVLCANGTLEASHLILDNRGATRLRLSNWPDTEAIRINVPVTLEPGNPASLITASATKQQL
jgi:hypothetical protein